MKFHPRLIVIPVVLAAIVIFTSITLYNRANSKDDKTLKVSGIIEATEVSLSPKIGGKIAFLDAEEGKAVKKGDLLAQLDVSELSAQGDQARALANQSTARLLAGVNGARPEQITQARAQLAQATAGVTGAYQALLNAQKNYADVTELKNQVDSAKARYDAAVAGLSSAQEGFNLIKKGARKDQIDQARAAVERTKIALERAEKDYARIDGLFRDGAVSQQTWEAAGTARDTALTAKNEAESRLADLLAGARPEEVRQAELAVEQAKANLEGARLGLENANKAYKDRLSAKVQLDAAKSAYDASLAQKNAAQAQLDLLLAGTRTEDVQALEASLKQSQAGVAYYDAVLKNAFLYSPVDGVIKTRISEVGEVANAGSVLAIILDNTRLWVKVYVPENKIGKLKMGQKVKVYTDSYPDMAFEGEIIEIGSKAEFTPKNIQTYEERVKQVFSVKVQVNDNTGKLKPGMPADAVITLD